MDTKEADRLLRDFSHYADARSEQASHPHLQATSWVWAALAITMAGALVASAFLAA